MATISGGNKIDGALSRDRVLRGSGAPTDGAAGTGAGDADPGSLYIDSTNGVVYQNTNTKASPTWTKVVNPVNVPNVADANVIGGIPVLHRIDIADAATGDVDVVLTHKTRVVDAWVVKTAGAGGAANTVQVKNGASAISDAMSINIADQAVARAAAIDDAQHEIAAGGTLRVTRTKAGGNAACIVYVLGIRVA